MIYRVYYGGDKAYQELPDLDHALHVSRMFEDPKIVAYPSDEDKRWYDQDRLRSQPN